MGLSWKGYSDKEVLEPSWRQNVMKLVSSTQSSLSANHLRTHIEPVNVWEKSKFLGNSAQWKPIFIQLKFMILSSQMEQSCPKNSRAKRVNMILI